MLFILYKNRFVGNNSKKLSVSRGAQRGQLQFSLETLIGHSSPLSVSVLKQQICGSGSKVCALEVGLERVIELICILDERVGSCQCKEL